MHPCAPRGRLQRQRRAQLLGARAHVLQAMARARGPGGQADTVVLVLPQTDHPMMSRELVYTAITRARSRLIILGDPERILQAASRRTQRSSGLGERLWQPSPNDSAQ